MTEFNPLAGAILSSAYTQRQLALDKGRNRRRAQVLEKDAAASEDRLEHQVESSDALPSIEEHLPKRDGQQEHDDAPQGDPADDNPPHIDITG